MCANVNCAIVAVLFLMVIVLIADACGFSEEVNEAFYGGGRARFRSGFSDGSLKENLVKAGWRLYTIDTCGFCQKQMDFLGGSYPARVKCDGGQCPLNGFPTWINDKTGQKAEGLQDIPRLEKMAQV